MLRATISLSSCAASSTHISSDFHIPFNVKSCDEAVDGLCSWPNTDRIEVSPCAGAGAAVVAAAGLPSASGETPDCDLRRRPSDIRRRLPPPGETDAARCVGTCRPAGDVSDLEVFTTSPSISALALCSVAHCSRLALRRTAAHGGVNSVSRDRTDTDTGDDGSDAVRRSLSADMIKTAGGGTRRPLMWSSAVPCTALSLRRSGGSQCQRAQ
mmetsp:Transcript_96/g.220  ORF Transcript_96/g.220 Transcript_96/m.220 type:complete len:212 (-) Transcript_96:276-911(-)